MLGRGAGMNAEQYKKDYIVKRFLRLGSLLFDLDG